MAFCPELDKTAIVSKKAKKYVLKVTLFLAFFATSAEKSNFRQNSTRHPTRHKPHRKPRHATRHATSHTKIPDTPLGPPQATQKAPTRRTARCVKRFRAQRLVKAAASDISGRSDATIQRRVVSTSCSAGPHPKKHLFLICFQEKVLSYFL